MPQQETSVNIKTQTKPLIKTYNGDGKSIVLGITGASGAIYGLRMLRALLLSEYNVELILSEYASYSLESECNVEIKPSNITSIFPEILMLKSSVNIHSNLDLKSELFQGGFNINGMVISPCSMGLLAGIADGECENLIEKCADWTLSHKKPLIIVPRETPINKIHLRNLTNVMDAGAMIVPAMPAFDYNPATFNDLADYIAGKVMDMLNNGEKPLV